MLCLDVRGTERDIEEFANTGRSRNSKVRKGMVTAVDTFLAIRRVAVFQREVGNWNWAPAAFQGSRSASATRLASGKYLAVHTQSPFTWMESLTPGLNSTRTKKEHPQALVRSRCSFVHALFSPRRQPVYALPPFNIPVSPL